MSASNPGARRPFAVGPAEDVRRVDGAGRERLSRRKPELRARERADERQALAERAARVEVRGQRDRAACVDERAAGRHRAAEEERARRQEDAHDVALRERSHAVRARRLEMVDRPGSELDRERDRSRLRELVAVQP